MRRRGAAKLHSNVGEELEFRTERNAVDFAVSLFETQRADVGARATGATSRCDRSSDDLGDLAVLEALNVANTMVSRNSTGSRSIAARSCSAFAFSISSASGVGTCQSMLVLAPFSSTSRSRASRSSMATMSCGGSFQPRIGRVAQDRQHPGARIVADAGVERAEGAQACFLQHVLGIGGVARQPARQRQRVRRCGITNRSKLLARRSLTAGSRADRN